MKQITKGSPIYDVYTDGKRRGQNRLKLRTDADAKKGGGWVKTNLRERPRTKNNTYILTVFLAHSFRLS